MKARLKSSLRTLHSSEATYQATAGNGNYAALAGLSAQGLIDPVLASGSKSGYAFELTPTDAVVGTSAAEFYGTAEPLTKSGVSQSGTRVFCIAEVGVMRGAVGVTKAGSRAACDALGALGNQEDRVFQTGDNSRGWSFNSVPFPIKGALK